MNSEEEKINNQSDYMLDDIDLYLLAEMKGNQKSSEERMQRYTDKILSLSVEERAEFIRKVINKYESDEYRDKEWQKGHEPECPLYDVIFEYGQLHGKPSCYKLNGYFSEEQYDIDGKFIVSLISGQGSFISVTEIPDDEPIPHIYKESTVEIYNPKDELICKTTSQTTLINFQTQIKKKKLEGYYVIYNKQKFPIYKSGLIKTSISGERFKFGDDFNDALKEFVIRKS